MKNKLLTLLVAVVILQSCVLNQDKVESETQISSKSSKLVKDALLKDGYELGIVKILDNSSCSFIIYNESSQAQLDPVNFNVSEYTEFKKNNLKIFFRYKPLRMMNRCNDAAPIELISVLKREG